MSLLIDDMDMPKSCMECFCLEAFDDEIYGRQHFCGLLGIDALAKEHSRHNKCPLSEIPTPHGRLIDADRLLEAFSKALKEDSYWVNFFAVNFFAIVENAPTVIEAEK